MMAPTASLYEFVSAALPEFRDFLAAAPEWYKQEMNYAVARRLLDFMMDLRHRSDAVNVNRLLERVELGMQEADHISGALCLDFIQPIADLPEDQRSEFVQKLGEASRRCYDSQ
jgi:hypothetical protein